MKKIFVCLISFAFLLFAGPLGAVGVQLRPTELTIEHRSLASGQAELLVTNIAQETALYQVTADDYADKISIRPSDFQLESGESRLVTVVSQIRRPGHYLTEISVVARPMGANGLVAASGVKVPIGIQVSGFVYLVIFSVILLILLGCLILAFIVKLKLGFIRNKDSNLT